MNTRDVSSVSADWYMQWYFDLDAGGMLVLHAIMYDTGM